MDLHRLLFWIVAAFLIAPQFLLAAKHYSQTQIQIQAEIFPDGSLRVNEARTYSFRGNFKWADYRLSLVKLGPVTEFSLTESGKIYLPDDSENPGTYQLTQTADEFYVKWFYRARNESRTFTLNYRVADAVTVYDDVAEFYYQFIGADAPKTIETADVIVALPFPADINYVRAWAHGPLHGQLAFDQGKLHLWARPLPKGNYWEARVIFPPEWVSNASVRRYKVMRDEIMLAEKKASEAADVQRLELRQKAEMRRQYAGRAWQLGMVLLAAGCLWWWFLYQQYGRSHQPQLSQDFTTEVPQALSPAVANYVYNTGQLTANALTATIFDLARRGYLKIEAREETKSGFWGTRQKTHYILKLVPEIFTRDQAQLAPSERALIQFIFNEIAAQHTAIDFEALKQARSKMTTWFRHWQKQIEQQWDQPGFFERASIKGTVAACLVAVVIIGSGIFLALKFGAAGIIPVVGGTILFGLAFAILRYTEAVKSIKSNLAAFRSYLAHFGAQTTVSESGELAYNHYLIYGVALGLSSKAIGQLLLRLPSATHVTYFPWYAAAMGHGSPTHFAAGISTMVTAVNTTMGNAAGIGGAASAGGGGAGGAAGGAG